MQSNSNLFRCRVLSCGGIIWWIFPSRLQTLSKLHFQTHIKCNPTLFNHLRQGIRASVSYAIFRIHTRVILFESILMAKAEIVNPFTLSHNQSTHTHYTIEKKNLFFLCKHAVRLFNCRCIVIYIVSFFHLSLSLSCLSMQHLNNLLEYYLEPLKRENFLSYAEITALFGNIQEIFTFQRQFLQNLEEALELEPDFHKFDYSSQFKVSLNTFSDVQSKKNGRNRIGRMRGKKIKTRRWRILLASENRKTTRSAVSQQEAHKNANSLQFWSFLTYTKQPCR